MGKQDVVEKKSTWESYDEGYEKEIIKIHFEGIRILVDYCEQLIVEGESAIEEL